MDCSLVFCQRWTGGAPCLFTASERILQDFAKEKKVKATFIKDLIQKCYITGMITQTKQTLMHMMWITTSTSS